MHGNYIFVCFFFFLSLASGNVKNKQSQPTSNKKTSKIKATKIVKPNDNERDLFLPKVEQFTHVQSAFERLYQCKQVQQQKRISQP